MSSKSSPSNIPQPDSYQSQKFEELILQEYLRQAQQTFNLCQVAIYTSLFISAIGAVLLFCGKAHEGTATTATGLISTTFCTLMVRYSSHKLESLRRSLREIRSRKR
jgi:hypothetical protein